jgi:hypothetical protein
MGFQWMFCVDILAPNLAFDHGRLAAEALGSAMVSADRLKRKKIPAVRYVSEKDYGPIVESRWSLDTRQHDTEIQNGKIATWRKKDTHIFEQYAFQFFVVSFGMYLVYGVKGGHLNCFIRIIRQ